jgi:simple sugar transport system substrate-binding protein
VAPSLDRAALLRRAAAFGAAGALPAALAEGAAAGAAPSFPPHPQWRFVFVNHVTTSPFFVATQYGAADACGLVGCTFEWRGSAAGDPHEAAAAVQAAVASKADGIAVCVVDRNAFAAPLARAAAAGIPTVAYYADAGRPGRVPPLAFVGQDPYVAGIEMGERIRRLVPRGDVGVFEPGGGAHDVSRRLDGVRAALTGHAGSVRVIPTGLDVAGQIATVDGTVKKRKRLRGLFGVDAGSTVGIALAVKKYRLSADGVRAGGMDVLPTTLQAIRDGLLDFTIDQQPYLQGFVPVLQLFLAKASGGLVQPSDTNTGLLFVTKANVRPYVATRTRFEGSSSRHQVLHSK